MINYFKTLNESFEKQFNSIPLKEEFKVGQKVLYNGKETEIIEVDDDPLYGIDLLIKNPNWDGKDQRFENIWVADKVDYIDEACHDDLDEALPKDLMKQIRQAQDAKYRSFNTSNSIYNPYGGKPKTGISDYANATYQEITADDVKAMKKAGQDLSGVYIMKNGGMINLTSQGYPEDNTSSEKGLRSNQSLNKSLEGADKIYLADIKDLIDSDPEKAHARLDNLDLRVSNRQLGHNRSILSTDTRGGSYYAQNARGKATIARQIAGIKAQYDAGDISRKEMEAEIARLQGRYSNSDYDIRQYNNIRNDKADARNKASEIELQKSFNNLKDARYEIQDAQRELNRSKKNLADAEAGISNDTWSSSDYVRAKSEVEKLQKQIDELTRRMARYQEVIDNGAQSKDIEKFTKEIEDQTARINTAQDKIDTLLRRK